MTKLGSGQLLAILLILRMFTFVCSTEPFSASHIGGAILSAAAQAILLLPIFLYYRNADSKLTKQIPSGWLLWGYALFSLCFGAQSMLRLWGLGDRIAAPIRTPLLAAVLLLLVCLYLSRLGLSALGRGSVIVLGILLLSLAVLFWGAYRHAEFDNLYTAQRSSLLACAWQDFCDSGELGSVFLLCSVVPKQRQSSVFSLLVWKSALIALISVLGIAVLGNLSALAEYPFFTLGAYSQPFSSQRSDAIYLLVCTLLGVTVISLQILLTAAVLGEFFPHCKYKESLSALAMLVLAYGSASLGSIRSHVNGILLLLLTAVIPLILWIRRHHHETSTSSGARKPDPLYGMHSNHRGA